MKILILSRNPLYYSTKRLEETSRKRGHRVTIADPLKCIISVSKQKINILLNSYSLTDYDLIIPRFGVIGLEYSLNILRGFELSGKVVLNSADAISLAKDKFNSLQLLKNKGLPVPHTVMVRSLDSVKQVIKQLGGFPVVAKFLKGAQGRGIMLVESMKSLKNLLSSLWEADYDIILQQFIAEAQGRDIRILVLGEKVLAAMRRYSLSTDFRANIHLGGRAEKISLPPSYEKLAKQAVKISRLQLAGVDIVESKQGPLIMEINASPGFEALEKTTGVDIAGQIIDYAVKLAS